MAECYGLGYDRCVVCGKRYMVQSQTQCTCSVACSRIVRSYGIALGIEDEYTPWIRLAAKFRKHPCRKVVYWLCRIGMAQHDGRLPSVWSPHCTWQGCCFPRAKRFMAICPRARVYTHISVQIGVI